MKKIFFVSLTLVMMALQVNAGITVQLINVQSESIPKKRGGDDNSNLLYYSGLYSFPSLSKACEESQLFAALIDQGFVITDDSENAAWKQITGISFLGDCKLNFADVFVLRYMAGFDSKGTVETASLNAESRVTNGNLSSINLQNVSFVRETLPFCFVYSSDANSDQNKWSPLNYSMPKYEREEDFDPNKIPDYAFYCLPKLEAISISSNCTRIGAHAFENNKNLSSIDFSRCNKLKAVDDYALSRTNIIEFDFTNCTSLTRMEEGCLQSNRCDMIILPPGLKYLGDYALESETGEGKEDQYNANIIFTCKEMPELGSKAMSLFNGSTHGVKNLYTSIYVRESIVDEMIANNELKYNSDGYGCRVFPLFEGNANGLAWRTFSYFRPLNMTTLTGLSNEHKDDIKAHTIKAYSNILGPVLENATTVTQDFGVLLEGKGVDGELYYTEDIKKTANTNATATESVNLLVGHWEGGFVPNAYENHYFMLHEEQFIPMLNEGEMPRYKAYLDLSEQITEEELQ